MITKDTLIKIDKITEEIIKYKNDKQLSWMKVYKEIISKLNYKEELHNDLLLIQVVKKITRLGYDIDAIPFKLTKYK